MRIDVLEHAAAPRPEELRIGVSTCLLGDEVRHDGGHKRDRFLTDTLGPLVTFVPTCPEVELGLGTPRDSMRLEQAQEGPRLVTPETGVDHTEGMRAWARERVARLAGLGLSGYVLKSRSPSCGMQRVKVWSEQGLPEKSGVGLFAAELMRALPRLPVEEEGRLHDPRLRENFFERVFAYRRLRTLFAGPWEAKDLEAFHAREELLIRARSPGHYEQLGRLVPRQMDTAREDGATAYQDLFMQAMATHAAPGLVAHVFQHMLGLFKDRLEPACKRELLDQIENHRAGRVPLLVPLVLLRHYARLHDVTWLAAQTFLDPHPEELMLRAFLV